jgi:hypothetical protein
MGTGYTRQSAAEIQTGEVIEAALLTPNSTNSKTPLILL